MVELDIFKGWGERGLPFGTLLHTPPPRRQRKLTEPLEVAETSLWRRLGVFSPTDTEQHTTVQRQCRFLTMLPLDVRMMIYETVLGNMAFHIGTPNNETSGRMLCYICQRPQGIEDDNHQECLDPSRRRPSSAPREDYSNATGLLPLLVSCRQIYSEAIETLYSANIFEFWQNQVAFKFLKIILPPQRLRCIRHFRWAMQFPHHPNINSRSQRDWSDLFAFFANETYGLQHLYLKLKRNHPVEAIIRQTPDDKAEGWIQPMLLMALDANRKRGCHVEIVTNGVVHEPVAIFHAINAAHKEYDYRDRLDLACTELHRRIRLSFDAPG